MWALSTNAYQMCILVAGLMRPAVNQKDRNCHFRCAETLTGNLREESQRIRSNAGNEPPATQAKCASPLYSKARAPS